MKISRFRVTNYRNVVDSGWIDVNDVTAFVGQNEAGKSNLFEALYRVNPFEVNVDYNLDEDWPLDRWGDKADAHGKVVCTAEFLIDDPAQILALFAHAKPTAISDIEGGSPLPESVTVTATRGYKKTLELAYDDPRVLALDVTKASAWIRERLPKFVFIREYDLEGSQVELNVLAQRQGSIAWGQLTANEQMMLTVLERKRLDNHTLSPRVGS